MDDDANIILIGMPGAGKSTVGVLLAKAMSRSFVDTDVAIQVAEGRRLQEIIDSEGIEAFLRIETEHVMALNVRRSVVAPGGSVVYSPTAMEHLKSLGPVVYLDVPLPVLEQRLSDLAVRGVVMAPGKTLADVFEERRPLYQRYAGITVNCQTRTQEQIVAQIVQQLAKISP